MTDDELNEAIATEVMGWRAPVEPGDLWCEDIKGHWFEVVGGPKRWATDSGLAIDDVVGRMREKGYQVVMRIPAVLAAARCEISKHGLLWPVEGTSLPRAICETALAAVRSGHEPSAE